MLFRRKKEKKKEIRKIFSFAFLIAIPCNFFLGAVGLFSVVGIVDQFTFDQEAWSLFIAGFIGSVSVISGSALPRFRTLVHELKHASVVLLTGNVLKNMKVGKGTGQVEYEMYEQHLHFAPIITLAPYFFPLLSLPTLVLAFVLEDYYRLPFALMLGLALGADIATAYGEMDPRQSDFDQIVGGRAASGWYVGATNFLWIVMCLIWIAGGRAAYVYFGAILAKSAYLIALKLGPHITEWWNVATKR